MISILWLMAGALPFADVSSVHELVRRQLHDPYPLLSDVRIDLPAPMVDAVATATAKDPTDRFGSVQEFLEALAPDAPATSSDNSTSVSDATAVIGTEVRVLTYPAAKF